MKRLLLLPVLLLAACGPVAGAGGPFKIGDRFTVTEVGREDAGAGEVITINQPGTLTGEKFWNYGGTVRVADRAWVRTTPDAGLFLAVSEVGSEVRLCITAPSGPGWKRSYGALVKETPSGYERFLDRLEGSGATLRDLMNQHGTCLVERG